MATKFAPRDVAHIAKLAHIPVTDKEGKDLAQGFTTAIQFVEKLNAVDVSGVEPLHTTGLTNVFRQDEVDESRQFTQKQALANAPHVHNGYFVVNQVIEQDDK